MSTMHKSLDPERLADLAADAAERPMPEWVCVEEPYDDTELELLAHIDRIRRRYDAEVKPFVDALVRSRRLKPVRRYLRAR